MKMCELMLDNLYELFTIDDCKKFARRLELEAYAAVVTALRVQGQFTKERKDLLYFLGTVLAIPKDRHKAEIRRVVNNEKLSFIANKLAGHNTDTAWAIEGRRLIKTFPRRIVDNSFTKLANKYAKYAEESMKQSENALTIVPKTSQISISIGHSEQTLKRKYQSCYEKDIAENPSSDQSKSVKIKTEFSNGDSELISLSEKINPENHDNNTVKLLHSNHLPKHTPPCEITDSLLNGDSVIVESQIVTDQIVDCSDSIETVSKTGAMEADSNPNYLSIDSDISVSSLKINTKPPVSKGPVLASSIARLGGNLCSPGGNVLIVDLSQEKMSRNRVLTDILQASGIFDSSDKLVQIKATSSNESTDIVAATNIKPGDSTSSTPARITDEVQDIQRLEKFED